MASGKALKLALFGSPVRHSLSPLIHRAFGAEAGIDLEYRVIESTPERFADDLAVFAESGGTGANLTVPVKQDGVSLCREIDRAATGAGAVNTLVRRGQEWFGSNTDGVGLVADLERLGLDVCGRAILILGAGGAVAGILGPLLELQPGRICILNRTGERTRSLAARFADRARIETGDLASGPAGNGFELVIQATSLGHQGRMPPLKRTWLAPGAVAYDLNYGPAHRDFRALCLAQELACHDGLGMLVEQAARAFALWTGRRPDPAGLVDRLRREG